MGAPPSLALVVPFHNEARHLPTLLRSLANHPHPEIPIVFVDNGSSDESAQLIRETLAASSLRHLLEEPRIGKFHAMATGATFCLQRLRASHVAYLDADCVCADGDWLGVAARMVQQHAATLGYLYSPFVFHDLADRPRFADAYRVYVAVERILAERVAWFAHAGAAVYEGEILADYLARANASAEIGLRLSLFALAAGRVCRRNPVPVRTSARRLLATPENFGAWAGYRRSFYTGKDINAADKLDLRFPGPCIDLTAHEVDWFFERQAIKFAGRNLIPLALFDTSDRVRRRLERFLRCDLTPALTAFRPQASAACVLGDGFHDLLEAVQRHPSTAQIAAAIHALFREHRLPLVFQSETAIGS